MTIWYTSDSHFGHENIIKYCGRPFKNAQEMDEMLIQKWNEVIRPSDHVWHLGDVHMGRSSNQEAPFIAMMKRLLGHKRLILGNHDHFPAHVYRSAGFQKIKGSHMHAGLLLTHYPVHPSSMGRARANVHGHIHEKDPYPPVTRTPYKDVWAGKTEVTPGVSPYINICVERTEYRPISLEELEVQVHGYSR